MNLVIDTGVWKKAEDENDRLRLSCLFILLSLAKKLDDNLVLDVENYIVKEYNNNLNTRLFEQIFIGLSSDNRIQYVSNKLDKKHKDKLKELKFDLADFPFVGTAMNLGKTIITVDSDYGVLPKEEYRSEEDYLEKQKVKDYMHDMMDLAVYHAEDFVNSI